MRISKTSLCMISFLPLGSPTLEHHQEAGARVGEQQGKGSAGSSPGCCHPLGRADECLLWQRTRALSQCPSQKGPARDELSAPKARSETYCVPGAAGSQRPR